MQFSGGRALSEAFEIIKNRFGAMLVVAVIFYVLLFGATFLLGAGMASQLALGMQSPDALAQGFGAGLILFYLVIYAIQFAQQLALTRLCSDRHQPSIGEAITAGFKGVPTMMGVILLLLVGGIALGIVLSLVFAAVAMGAQSGSLVALLVVLLVVGGLYLMARLCLLNPIVAIDEVRNPITVISRTWSLTSGHALKLVLIFAAVLVVAVVVFLTAMFVTMGGSMLAAFGNPGGAAPAPAIAGVLGFVALMLILAIAFGLYFVALMAAIHRQLAGTTTAAAEAFE